MSELLKGASLSLFLLLFASCSTQRLHGHLIPVKENGNPETIDAFIVPYKDSLDLEMNEVIACSAVFMDKDIPESLLGNWVADAVMSELRDTAIPGITHIDCVVLNYGGLRNALPSGAVKVGDIFKLMPFDNEVVVAKMSLSAVNRLFEQLSAMGGAPVSGCTIDIDEGRIQSWNIGAGPPDSAKYYYLATSDYLLNGGDHMSSFGMRDTSFQSGLLIRDLLIDYCRKENALGHKLNAHLDDRIH